MPLQPLLAAKPLIAGEVLTRIFVIPSPLLNRIRSLAYLSAMAIIGAVVSGNPAVADPTEIERALEAITNTADRICSVIYQRSLTREGKSMAK